MDVGLIEAIMKRVVKDDRSGHWIWQSQTGNTQAQIKYEGKWYQVVRVLFESEVKSLKKGEKVYRMCSNLACVNPYHCEAKTKNHLLSYFPYAKLGRGAENV